MNRFGTLISPSFFFFAWYFFHLLNDFLIISAFFPSQGGTRDQARDRIRHPIPRAGVPGRPLPEYGAPSAHVRVFGQPHRVGKWDHIGEYITKN